MHFFLYATAVSIWLDIQNTNELLYSLANLLSWSKTPRRPGCFQPQTPLRWTLPIHTEAYWCRSPTVRCQQLHLPAFLTVGMQCIPFEPGSQNWIAVHSGMTSFPALTFEVNGKQQCVCECVCVCVCVSVCVSVCVFSTLTCCHSLLLDYNMLPSQDLRSYWLCSQQHASADPTGIHPHQHLQALPPLPRPSLVVSPPPCLRWTQYSNVGRHFSIGIMFHTQPAC